jgi:4-amino-4-deoxy-L-arabinose transferase-like glycosyltransferase
VKKSRDEAIAGEETAVTVSYNADTHVGKPSDSWRFALPLLLMLYLGFACAHALVVPVGQTGYQNAPDEAAHVNFVHSVASFHLPTHDHPTPFSKIPVANGYEWHQPPLYYLVAAPFLVFGERGVRFCSILLGLCALLLIYRAGRLLFPADRVVALLAVGLAALTPTHIAITSTVNNDVLLEVCFSATLLLLIGALQNGFTRRTALWIGLTIGGAILTKATGLLLLPLFGFALFLIWRSGTSWRELARYAAVTLVIVALLSGWWFVRNQALYGQPLPLRLFAADFGMTVQAAPIAEAMGGWGAYYLQAAIRTFLSFWAVYGRTAYDAATGEQEFLPVQIYLLLGIACLCAAGGMVRLHLQRRALFTKVQLQSLWTCFLTIALVGMSYLAFIAKYFQMQGRYLFPAMLPIALVFALAFRGAFPERWKNPASGLLLALLGATAFAFLRFVMP